MIYGDGGHAKVIREILVTPVDSVVVAIGDNNTRRKVVRNLEAEWRKKRLPIKFGVAIHSGAIVSPTAKIGEGTVVMAGAVIQAEAVIGKHCIINTCASVDHECILQPFVHIAPGAHLCGGVFVGEGGFVGTGVCLAPGFRVPEWTLIKSRRIKGEDYEGKTSE